MAYLLTNGPMPQEYLELVLCRDVYHCLPSELDEQDAYRINDHIVCLAAEEKAHKAKAKK